MINKIYPNTIFQAIALLLLGLIPVVPIIGLNQYFNFLRNPELESSVIYLCLCISIILISAFINRKREIKTEIDLKLKQRGLLPLMILCVIAFKIGINAPINKILESVFDIKTSTTNPFNSLIFTIGILIVAPIMEELIFRGIILKGFCTNYPPSKAIIISAIIFGFVHGKPLQIWGAIIIGLFLGYIYYKTQSIGITIVLHFSANLSAILTTYLTNKFGNNSITNMYGSLTLYILIICAIISITSFQKIWQRTNRTLSTSKN